MNKTREKEMRGNHDGTPVFGTHTMSRKKRKTPLLALIRWSLGSFFPACCGGFHLLVMQQFCGLLILECVLVFKGYYLFYFLWNVGNFESFYCFNVLQSVPKK